MIASIRNDPDKNNMIAIGNRLRQLRENYGKANGSKLSIEKFGKILLDGLGMTDSAICNLVGDLERGSLVISPAILQRYSQLCGVPIDYIVNGAEYAPAPAMKDITLKDLCHEIVNLDECGLIDILNEDGKCGILFREPYRCNIWEVDMDEQAYLAAMWTFIEHYATAKKISQLEVADRLQLERMAVKGALSEIDGSNGTLSAKEMVEYRQMWLENTPPA